MSLLNDPPFPLGQTLGVESTSDGTGWVGALKEFPDVDPVTGKVRSNRRKVCIAVRNRSGVALLPKRVVTWKSGSFSEVDGYTAATDGASAGVVDEWLPATGVANNDVFWLTVQGPTEVKLGPGLQAAADAALVALTAAASTHSTTAGQAQTAAATFLQNGYIGRAISAGTTAQNVLAVVNLVRS
jgi:hypothetical protein